MEGKRSRATGWLMGTLLGFTTVIFAADYKVDTVAGRLVLNIDVNWSLVDNMPEGMEGAVGFRVGDGSTMQWVFTPANEHGVGMGAGADMRELTMELKEMLEGEGGIISDGLQSIQTDRVRGFYVRAVDPAPRPGEWKFMYTGWVAVDSHPVMFNIVWNQGGQSSADRALASVRTMRLERR
jgi:hypothetical protein